MWFMPKIKKMQYNLLMLVNSGWETGFADMHNRTTRDLQMVCAEKLSIQTGVT